MKNPKVGKAEILESVVHFLKTEKEMKAQKATELQTPTCSGEQAYDEGRRSCLRRINHFMSSKSKELMDAGEGNAVPASLALPQPQLHSGHVYGAVCDSLSAIQQPAAAHPHPHPQPQPHLTVSRTRCDTQGLSWPLNITEPVWRPWPK